MKSRALNTVVLLIMSACVSTAPVPAPAPAPAPTAALVPLIATDHMAAHVLRVNAAEASLSNCTELLNGGHLNGAVPGTIVEALIGTVVVSTCVVNGSNGCELRVPVPCGIEQGAVSLRKHGEVGPQHAILTWDHIHIAPFTGHRRPSRPHS